MRGFQKTVFVFAMFASSCAPPLQTPAVQVQAAPHDLAREAAAALPKGDAHSPILQLEESVLESIESFAEDGTAGAHKIRYALRFRFGDNARREISLEQIVPAAESRYLASRRAREDAIVRLRRDALRQMRYILARQN